MQEITKEEFLQWKNSAVTEAIINELVERKKDYLNSLRGFVSSDNIVSAARCQGLLEGIELLTEIEYGDGEFL